MRRVFGVVFLLGLFVSVPAAAQSPGSAVDQYRESIPGGGGNQTINPSGGSGGGTGDVSQPASGGSASSSSGASGAPGSGITETGGGSVSETAGGSGGSGGGPSPAESASGEPTHNPRPGAERVAAATAPAGLSGDRLADGSGSTFGPADNGSSFGDTLSHALGGGTEGMGIVFPIALGLSLLGALLVLFRRRRAGGWRAS